MYFRLHHVPEPRAELEPGYTVVTVLHGLGALVLQIVLSLHLLFSFDSYAKPRILLWSAHDCVVMAFRL
jgi:hypothetical protein